MEFPGGSRHPQFFSFFSATTGHVDKFLTPADISPSVSTVLFPLSTVFSHSSPPLGSLQRTAPRRAPENQMSCSFSSSKPEHHPFGQLDFTAEPLKSLVRLNWIPKKFSDPTCSRQNNRLLDHNESGSTRS